MAKMTTAERIAKKASDKARAEKLNRIYEENKQIVRCGKCPECGCKLKANLAITGWFVCEQRGAVGFRKDASKPSCDFQCFTQ